MNKNTTVTNFIKKVTFSTGGTGGVNCKLNIAAGLLERIGVTAESREVEISLDGDKIIIKKAKMKKAK